VTKDFKERAHPNTKAKPKRCFCFVWLIAGALIGGFAVGLLWLRLDPALVRSGDGLAGTGIPRPAVDESQRPPPSDSLEFEFPDLLRDMVVPVPEDPPPQQAKAKPPAVVKQPPPKPAAPKPTVTKAEPPKPAAVKPAPKPSEPSAKPTEREAYLLQLGSFRKSSDAENLKARLAMMGVVTRIQKVTINNNDTFHRVRSGPYRSKKELEEVRSMLRRNNIKTIVIKWKG